MSGNGQHVDGEVTVRPPHNDRHKKKIVLGEFGGSVPKCHLDVMARSRSACEQRRFMDAMLDGVLPSRPEGPRVEELADGKASRCQAAPVGRFRPIVCGARAGGSCGSEGT